MSVEAKLPVAIEELSPEHGAVIYLADNGLTPYFDYIKAETANEVPDLSTLKGRKRIASLAAKVASSKKAIEKPGRDYLKELKAQPKTVETNLREFVRACDALKDEVRAPLTQWEEEQARIKAEQQAKVDYFSEEYSAAVEALAAMPLNEKVDFLKGVIEEIQQEVIDDSFGELKEAGEKAKVDSLEKLNQLVAAAAIEIDNQRKAAEEAERQRVEREKQIAAEAAARAKAEAEAKAKAEQEALERKAKEEAEAIARKAEQEKQALIAEQQRKEAEAKAAEEAKRQEEFRRQQDINHRKSVNNDILSKLAALGVSEEQGKAIITAAARHQLGNMVINY